MPKTTPPTIYDVARKAAVSIATVSRVLNNPERVTTHTRERVLATIEEVGFVPRPDAAERAYKRTGRIGVLAPFFTYPSFVQRLHGISAELADSDFELVIYNVDSSTRRDTHLVRLPATRRLDGLIIMALPLSEQAAQRLVDLSLDTVLIEGAHHAFSSIDIDNQYGGCVAAKYLVGQGHRRCAFVGDSVEPDYAIFNSQARLAGFRAGLAVAGIALPDQYVALAPHGLRPAREQAHRLLSLAEPPTAIFAASDTQAIGVLQAARERGLRVPADLAIVGFDDIEAAEFVGLTTIRQPLEESGRVAVELLRARLANGTRPVQHVQLPLTIVRRATA